MESFRKNFIKATLAVGLVLLATSSALALKVESDFAQDPFAFTEPQPGNVPWVRHGATHLFEWDASRQALAVTWDSTEPNSYCHQVLPRSVNRSHAIRFGFTLELDHHAAGVVPEMPGTFQIAIGLIRREDAFDPEFQRSVLLKNANLMEWTWFGSDTHISSSVSPVIVPSDGRLPWGYSDTFVALTPGPRYRFELYFDPGQQRLDITMEMDGMPGPILNSVILPPAFTDFNLDAFSFNSYSGAGQHPNYAGSVFARGWIDDVYWEVPDPPRPELVNVPGFANHSVSLQTEVGWDYQLEGSMNFKTWEPLGDAMVGTGEVLLLSDFRKASFPHHFYRVRLLEPKEPPISDE